MPSSRHILSFAEYAAIRHPTPYLVEVERDGSHLLLLGGLHSSDPADPIFGRIDAAFSRLLPAFALHEGTPPAVEPDREIAIRRHGEAGLVRHLAARAGIGTASMDIPDRDPHARLRGRQPRGGSRATTRTTRSTAAAGWARRPSGRTGSSTGSWWRSGASRALPATPPSTPTGPAVPP